MAADPVPTENRDRPIPWRRCLVATLLALLGWAVLRTASHRPELVERYYSEAVFPPLRDGLRFVSSLLPFSLAELLLLLLVARIGWLVIGAFRSARAKRRRWGSLFLHGSVRGITFAGFVYLVFLLIWGFNHARLPYAAHAGLEVAPVSKGELFTLGLSLVHDCNRLGRGITDEDFLLEQGPGGVDPSLLRGYRALAEEVPTLKSGTPLLRLPWVSPLLSFCGIAGIYSPFTAEAHLNREIPAWVHPFAACHEIAHLKGFAREDEANFIAWQVCRRSGDVVFEYSASVRALGFVLSTLASVDRPSGQILFDMLEPRVRDDRRRSRDFWQAHHGPVMELSTATNDAYLRSQGQEAGVRSYGRMVDLLVAERR
jgi:hypothetical protein